VSIEEGVSIPIAYTTAYQSLVNVARMQKGESVLIHAAAGGRSDKNLTGYND
jgi:NADPH:quinone reductase-like Zn-dependent oxidoreductase